MVDCDDSLSVTVEVTRCETFKTGKVAARADCEVILAGVSFTIHSCEVRRHQGHLTVELPHCRDRLGFWIPAITLPEELEKPLGRAIAEAAGFVVAEG